MTKLGVDIRVIWIASPPRCGSMWTYNVTRQIVRAGGLEALPAVVPMTFDDMVRTGDEAVRDATAGRVRVLKVHKPVRPDLPYARFILPRRDLRDSLVSYMRFMRCSFENALRFVDTAIAAYRHYDGFPRGLGLPVEYADIDARPAMVARAIAGFLGVEIEEDVLLDIVRMYSKESVQRLIQRKEQDIARRSREGRPIMSDEVVVLGPENIRVFDAETGFQSGHVSHYREGDWRSILTREQTAQLDARIAAGLAPVAET